MYRLIMTHEVEKCLSIYLSLYRWLYSPLLDLRCFFSFLIFYTVGMTPWTGYQPVARAATCTQDSSNTE
jgi:hypothetical protein